MLFALTCLYLLVFYYQPGGRIAVLDTIRFELLLGAAILGFIFFTRSGRIFTKEKMTKAAFIFFGGMCLSFIGAAQTHTVSDAYLIFINLLKSFSIYLMIIGTVETKEQLEKLLWVFLVCMAILVVEPFLLSLQGLNLYAKEAGIIRLYGVGQFAHPNGLGTYAVTTLVLLYFFFWHYRSLLIRLSFVGFGLICLRVIMLTASRTAYVGLVIFILLLFVYSKRKLQFALGVLLVTVILSGSVPDMYKDRFLSLKEVTGTITGEEESQGSVGGRWDLIRDAWDVFLRYPVFGCGMDTFQRIPISSKQYRTTGATHNLLMQVLAETGLVGLIAFLFLSSTLWKTINAPKMVLSDEDETSNFLFMVMNYLKIFFLVKLLVGLAAQHSLYSNVWWMIGGIGIVNLRIADKSAVALEAAASQASVVKPEASLLSLR